MARNVRQQLTNALTWWWQSHKSGTSATVFGAGWSLYVIWLPRFFDGFYTELFAGVPALPLLAWFWGAFTFGELLLLGYFVVIFLLRRAWLIE